MMAARIVAGSTRRLIAGAVVIGVVIAVVIVAMSLSRSEAPRSPSTTSPNSQGTLQQGISPQIRDFMSIFDETQPLFPAGKATTLEDAPAVSGSPVWQPEARADQTPEVWVSEDAQEVGLRYGSDLVLLQTPWPPGAKDPETTYAEQAESWKAGYTTEIDGHAAWVIPAGSREPEQPPVSVIHVAIDGIDVTLYGRMKVDDLVAIAETLEA
jgi:hypothetical protein